MWKETRLGDCVSHLKGYAFKSGWDAEKGQPIVKVGDFTEDSIDVTNLTYIDRIIAAEYQRFSVTGDDVIIQTVGSWPSNPRSVVGKVISVPSEACGALLNQNAVKLIPSDEIHNRFLFYLLKYESFSDFIIGCAQGAASQASITLKDILSFNFRLPPCPIQRKIASILSAYDDLIENNNRRTKILEEMAQAIYREWFVHFRFPGHENVPMVDSELGRIPQGWEFTSIRDCVEKYIGEI